MSSFLEPCHTHRVHLCFSHLINLVWSNFLFLVVIFVHILKKEHNLYLSLHGRHPAPLFTIFFFFTKFFKETNLIIFKKLLLLIIFLFPSIIQKSFVESFIPYPCSSSQSTRVSNSWGAPMEVQAHDPRTTVIGHPCFD